MKKTYLPRGCDQQGRYPQAAESCTELGCDDCPPSEWELVKASAIDLLLALAIVTVVGAIVWLVL